MLRFAADPRAVTGRILAATGLAETTGMRSLLLLALLSLAAPAAGSPLDPDVRSWSLRNGIHASLVRGQGPATLVVRIAAGRRHDPPGQEGLADVVARSLMASTSTMKIEGELARALAETTEAAWVEVDDEAIWLVLEGVRDTGSALRLTIDMVAAPTFHAADFDAVRRSLALELWEDRRGADRPRALARSLASPARPATPWSVDGLRRSQAFEFHRARFGRDTVRLALAGAFPESDEQLETTLQRSFGTWLQESGADAGSGRSPAERGGSLLLRGADAEGLAVAWPELPEVAAGASLLALRAAAGPDWSVRGNAASVSGDACQDATLGLLAEADGEPTRLERRLQAGLERLARRPPAAARLQALREDLVEEALADGPAFVDLECPGEASPFLRLERLLHGLEPADLSRAARALLDSPSGRVARSRSGDEAFGWRMAHPGGAVVDAQGAPTPEGTAAEARGEKLWREARLAHGGDDALERLATFTMISEKTLKNDRGTSLLGRMRLDANPQRGELRQEARRGTSLAGISLVVLKGRQVQTRTVMGAEVVGRVGVQSMWQELRHLPPVLLRSQPLLVRTVAAPESAPPAREWLQLFQRDGTTSLVGLDAEAHLVRDVRFVSRLPGDRRREVRIVWQDLRPLEGALMPWATERSSWPHPPELDFVTLDRVTQFRAREADFDAAGLTTHPDDLERELESPTGR